MRILLVEDNPADVALAREYLRESGLEHSLETCQTLAAALVSLEAHPPDVLLLDLGLPDATGTEGLERIRARTKEVPVVVLTANELGGLACVREGAQDFIPKDEVSANVLARALGFAIERLKLQRRLEPNREELNTRLSRTGIDLDLVAHGLSLRSRDPHTPPLSEGSPGVIDALTETYAELVRGALEEDPQQLLHVEARYALADQLAYLAAKPGDLIDLHRRAVHRVAPHLSAADQLRLATAGPELLIQMLGHLAGAYRHHSLAQRRAASA